MDWLRGWWIASSASAVLASGVAAQASPCPDFHAVLEEVPHLALTTRPGPIESIWPSEPVAECEVVFQTTDEALGAAVAPSFLADPGTEMYQAGWRMIPEILADGAGSGVHGVQRRGVRCVVHRAQPAYLDDDGTLVQSDTLSMRIQCTGPPGR